MSHTIKNKKAFFNYEILENYEAGVSLLGAEVKSLRAGRGSLIGAFITIRDGQAFLKNFQIPKWEFSQAVIDPLRDRRLLLKKKEIKKLENKLNEQGLTVIPLKIYFKRGLVKVEIALAQGKKKHDKRQVIKERDEKRRLDRRLKNY